MAWLPKLPSKTTPNPAQRGATPLSPKGKQGEEPSPGVDLRRARYESFLEGDRPVNTVNSFVVADARRRNLGTRRVLTIDTHGDGNGMVKARLNDAGVNMEGYLRDKLRELQVKPGTVIHLTACSGAICDYEVNDELAQIAREFKVHIYAHTETAYAQTKVSPDGPKTAIVSRPNVLFQADGSTVYLENQIDTFQRS